MAKFEKASDEVISIFNRVRDNTSIPHWVNFEVFCNDKQKDLHKIVKLNDLVEKLTDGVNFVVVFNESVLIGLTDEQQEMVMNECLAGVGVNESDVIQLEKPNFTTYRGVLQKYGHDPIITLHESIKSLFDAKKQKDEEAKSQPKPTAKRTRRKW